MDFSSILTAWYRQNGRRLPWRETADPYRIWISEIILQQTRVAQGYDYYLRFVGRFPDVQSLAQADEDEVLRLWQGLGYYSRARNLHAAAKSMNGRFPDTYEGVRALKGVGDYTAAAVCSIAYGLPYAVVDGNVYRVLARFFGISDPIDTAAGKKRFAELAAALLDPKQPGIYNQAIMDFGAVVCTPVSPGCLQCPLQAGCAAFGSRQVDRLPVKTGKTKTRIRYLTCFYAIAGTHTFIRKRTGRDIWRGLYEFPMVETDEPMDDPLENADFRRLFEGIGGVEVRLLKRGVRHVLSHQTLMADFYEVRLPAHAEIRSFQKVEQTALSRFAFPKLLEKFWRIMLKNALVQKTSDEYYEEKRKEQTNEYKNIRPNKK